MKVHGRKLKNRVWTILVCMALAITAIASPIKAYASTTDYNARVVDVALTKTGVVANTEIGKTVEATARLRMREALIEYDNWLKENNITEINLNTFEEFIAQCEAGTAGASIQTLKIMGMLYEPAVSNWIANYRLNSNEEVDIVELTTGNKVTDGNNVELSDDFVTWIREIFEDYADSDAPYVYVNTLSPENINPLWFNERTQYLTVKDYIANSEYPIHITMLQHTGLQYFSTGSDNTYKAESIHIVAFNKPHGIYRYHDTLGSDSYSIVVGVVGEDWEAEGFPQFSQNVSQLGNIQNSEYWSESQYTTIFCNFNQDTEGYGRAWLATKDGRVVKVFKTLDDYKNFTVGREPYYITTTSGSYNTTDNSVKVSGDYITGSNYEYSHDVVQNEIDNSQNVDNSVVNNIVNNNQQTIINNYASTVVPDSGSDDNGSDNDGGFGSILDGLGSIFGGITDIIGFLLGVVGDALSLISSLFTTIFDALKALGTMFSGFGGLLGEIFGFIPSELISFIVLAIEAAVAIAIWKQFKK